MILTRILFTRSVFLLFFCFFCGSLYAQSNEMEKQLSVATALANDDKLSDADSVLSVLVAKNPSYGDGWDMLMTVRYKLYDNVKSLGIDLSGTMNITAKDENGKDISTKDSKEMDSLKQQLNELLKNMSPSKIAYAKLLYTMRKSLMYSTDAFECSFYLRKLLVDVDVDSNVSPRALASFKKAEKEFVNKNYNEAAILYRKAYEDQPDFYKAHMYLGDCYYATGNFTDAITAFKEARDKFPFLLEPRKYLVDAYAKIHLYDKALDEAINGVAIYPDLSMLRKLEDAAYLNDQKVNIKWTPRGTLPNKVAATKPRDINEYSEADDTAAVGPWHIYKEAGAKISPYCNEKGIITERNSLTQSRYMEVYSWEQMLKNSKDPVLDEARRMQALGYLDCYVLVSCFQYDLYPQYLDFVRENKEKVLAYYKACIKSR